MSLPPIRPSTIFFFFNDTATTEIYTLSLHDALPICCNERRGGRSRKRAAYCGWSCRSHEIEDRKSTRLNSSHPSISYAVFCLKKKKKKTRQYAMNTYRRGAPGHDRSVRHDRPDAMRP